MRGLNDPAAIDNLQNYIKKNLVDSLFIQEHKLRGHGAINLGRLLWHRTTTFFTGANIGYTLDGKNVGKGGVASLIAPKWAKFITFGIYLWWESSLVYPSTLSRGRHWFYQCVCSS